MILRYPESFSPSEILVYCYSVWRTTCIFLILENSVQISDFNPNSNCIVEKNYYALIKSFQPSVHVALEYIWWSMYMYFLQGLQNKRLRLSRLPVLKLQKDQKLSQRSQNQFLIQYKTIGPVLEHRGLHLLRDPPHHKPRPKGDPQHHHNVPILLPPPKLSLCPLLDSDQARSPNSDILVLCHQLVMAVVKAICHQPCWKYPLFSCPRKLSNWHKMR